MLLKGMLQLEWNFGVFVVSDHSKSNAAAQQQQEWSFLQFWVALKGM